MSQVCNCTQRSNIIWCSNRSSISSISSSLRQAGSLSLTLRSRLFKFNGFMTISPTHLLPKSKRRWAIRETQRNGLICSNSLVSLNQMLQLHCCYQSADNWLSTEMSQQSKALPPVPLSLEFPHNRIVINALKLAKFLVCLLITT